MKMRDVFCAVALLSAAALSQVTVDFTADVTTGTNPVDVTFTPIVSGTAATFVIWSFGDGSSSLELNPTHTYTAAGSFTVGLTVLDGGLSFAEVKEDFVVVAGADLAPEFSVSSTSGTNPATFEFTDMSTGVTPTAWLWAFGDGEESSEQNPSHTYNAPGVYDVTLIISLGAQAESLTKAELITVNPASLTADFEVSARAGNSPFFVEFTDTSTGVTPDTWRWGFGDGETSDEQHPSHDYVETGDFAVTLELTFGGQTASITKPAVWVGQPEFDADFEIDVTQGVNPLTVSFTDTTDLGGSGNVEPDKRSWLFIGSNGGSVGTTNPSPTITFSTPGTYGVSLTVEYGDVTETVRRDNVFVVEPAPIFLDFTADVTEGEVPLTVQFENLTTGTEPDAWSWSFFVPPGVSKKNPTVTFTVPGTYPVVMYAFIGDQMEVVRKDAFIHVRPRRLAATFTSDRVAGEVPLTVSFEGATEGEEPTAYSWRFVHSDDLVGPVLTSDVQNPEITFDVPGRYTVEFTAWYEGQQAVQTVEHYLDLAPPPACREVENVAASHGVSEDFEASEDFIVSGTAAWVVAYDTTNYALQEIVGADELGVVSIPEWSIDGSLLILGSPYPAPIGYVSIVDLTTGEKLSQFTRPEGDPTELFGDGVDLQDGRALIGADGFAYLYDVSDPSAPEMISRFKQTSIPGDPWFTDVVLHGDRALLASRYGWAFLFDISDPTAPVELAAQYNDLEANGQLLQIALNDKIAMMGTDFAPVIVFDAQTGALRGELVPPFPANHPAFGIALAVSDDYAIVGSAHDWHDVFSGVAYLFDLETLELAGRVAPGDGVSDEHFGWGLDVVGSTLYAASPFYEGLGRLHRFDLPNNAVWFDAGGGSIENAPTLVGNGELCPQCDMSLALSDAPANAPLFFVIGQSEMPTPFAGGVMVPAPDVRLGGYSTNAFGNLYVRTSVPNVIPPGTSLLIQAWVRDTADSEHLVGSNAVRATVLGDLR